MTFFEGWLGLFKNGKVNKDLQNWARIEYKCDSDFAYNYMISHGRAPTDGALK